MSSGTTSSQVATRPTSTQWKMGAVGSGFTATMVPLARTPTVWLNFPPRPSPT